MIPVVLMAAGRVVGIAGLALVAGGVLGYAWEHRARLAEVATLRAELAQREARAADAAQRRHEAAQRATDLAWAERERRIEALAGENARLREQIVAATRGRPCLGRPARRLLEQASAFRASGDVPAAAVDTPRADAAAATPADHAATGRRVDDRADDAPSTDTDVAAWIIEAASLYEQCRSRIDALRVWAHALEQ